LLVVREEIEILKRLKKCAILLKIEPLSGIAVEPNNFRNRNCSVGLNVGI